MVAYDVLLLTVCLSHIFDLNGFFLQSHSLSPLSLSLSSSPSPHLPLSLFQLLRLFFTLSISLSPTPPLISLIHSLKSKQCTYSLSPSSLPNLPLYVAPGLLRVHFSSSRLWLPWVGLEIKIKWHIFDTLFLRTDRGRLKFIAAFDSWQTLSRNMTPRFLGFILRLWLQYSTGEK